MTALEKLACWMRWMYWMHWVRWRVGCIKRENGSSNPDHQLCMYFLCYSLRKFSIKSLRSKCKLFNNVLLEVGMRLVDSGYICSLGVVPMKWMRQSTEMGHVNVKQQRSRPLPMTSADSVILITTAVTILTRLTYTSYY